MTQPSKVIFMSLTGNKIKSEAKKIKICCKQEKKKRMPYSIQMGTNNKCLHKEVDKKYTGYNLKTTELFDCGLMRLCAVIRSNAVFQAKTYVSNSSGSLLVFSDFVNSNGRPTCRSRALNMESNVFSKCGV